jgi:CheY-like chemotaxis protein
VRDVSGKVLFVDDERMWAQNYVDQLEKSGYEVTFRGFDVDLCECIMREATNVLVLDVMGAAPERLKSRSPDGMRTGLALLETGAELIRQHSIPVAILTNRGVEEIKGELAGLSFANGLVEVHRKIDVSAKQLPIVVKALIDCWKR